MTARPIKKQSECLSKKIQIMVTEEQYRVIVALAMKHGYTNISEYIRRVALGEQSVTK